MYTPPAKLSRSGWTVVTVAPKSAQIIGYARISTNEHDLTAQRKELTGPGVPEGLVYVDHGLTGRNKVPAADGHDHEDLIPKPQQVMPFQALPAMNE